MSLSLSLSPTNHYTRLKFAANNDKEIVDKTTKESADSLLNRTDYDDGSSIEVETYKGDGRPVIIREQDAKGFCKVSRHYPSSEDTSADLKNKR